MRRRAIPEVLALFRSGGLSQADLMYVRGLRPESQLAAARKCLRPDFTMVPDRSERSRITHPKVCGGRRV